MRVVLLFPMKLTIRIMDRTSESSIASKKHSYVKYKIEHLKLKSFLFIRYFQINQSNQFKSTRLWLSNQRENGEKVDLLIRKFLLLLLLCF